MFARWDNSRTLSLVSDKDTWGVVPASSGPATDTQDRPDWRAPVGKLFTAIFDSNSVQDHLMFLDSGAYASGSALP